MAATVKQEDLLPSYRHPAVSLDRFLSKLLAPWHKISAFVRVRSGPFFVRLCVQYGDRRSQRDGGPRCALSPAIGSTSSRHPRTVGAAEGELTQKGLGRAVLNDASA
jgi:hypothetical protein